MRKNSKDINLNEKHLSKNTETVGVNNGATEVSTEYLRNQIPLYRKFNLTITEAVQYFNIGEKSLRRVISDNPTADYILMVGNKVLLKRELFEKFINETSSI